MFDTFKLFSTLLTEYETDSFIKMLKVNSKHKANKKPIRNFDEESMESFIEDDPEDIFNQNFNIYSLDYLCEEKIGQLLEYIQKVCRWYWN